MSNNLIKDSRGNMAIGLCATLIPLMLAAGLAVDYSSGSRIRSELQSAADAAALAGVALQTYDADKKSEEANRLADAHLQMMGLEVGNVIPDVAANLEKVTVAFSTEIPTTFLKIVGVDTVKVSTSATAVPASATPICMLALNPSDPSAVRVTGTPVLEASECAVQANSSHQEALHLEGAAAASAETFCVKGGYHGTRFEPRPRTGCPAVPDPYAGLPVPSDLACDDPFDSDAEVAYPGVYCGGIDVSSHTTVTFKPGLYVVRDGPLRMRAHSTVMGEGVTFYFYGDDAVLDIRSHSNVDLTAPKSGPYAGIALAQHAASSTGMTSSLAGGASIRIVGALYFPTQVLDVGGASGIGANSPYMPIVADRFVLRGNGAMSVKADYEAAGFEDVLAKIYTGARLTR